MPERIVHLAQVGALVVLLHRSDLEDGLDPNLGRQGLHGVTTAGIVGQDVDPVLQE